MSEALERAGISGRNYLRENLGGVQDAKEWIRQFQQENSVLLPSLRPVLKLLDLHGITRSEFHESLVQKLQSTLVKRVEDLRASGTAENEQILQQLLDKGFPFIKDSTFEPVVFSLLKNAQPDDSILKRVLMDRDLYAKADVAVKRQVWQEHQALFSEEVHPLLFEYVREKDKTLLFNMGDGGAPFFVLNAKQRRSAEIVKKLVDMIGKNAYLYDTTIQFVRSLFVKTRSPHYCSLRTELLMALHDGEVKEITSFDPAFHFCLAIDACIRENNVDTKRLRQLEALLAKYSEGDADTRRTLGDAAMLLFDPYTTHFIATSTLRLMMKLITNEALARDNSILLLLLRLMNLGLSAWDMLSSQIYREPKLHPEVVTGFVPLLMSLMVDDQVRALNSKLPADDRDHALTIIEHSGPPPDRFVEFVCDERMAALLCTYYTFSVLKEKDVESAKRVLGILLSQQSSEAALIVLQDHLIHMLVSLLIPLSDDISKSSEFSVVVFDEFFIPSIPIQINSLYHLMKLVYHIHPYLPEERIESLMKNINTSVASFFAKSPEINKMLGQLQDKLRQYERYKEDLSVPRSAGGMHDRYGDDLISDDLPIPAPTPRR